jgi:hypothetical protein
MKFNYSELLVMLVILFIAVAVTWTTVYYLAPCPVPPESRISSGSTDGPEMQKIKKIAER